MADGELRILQKIELPPFRPLRLWRGGDLQTLRNWLRPPKDTLDQWPGEGHIFNCHDGSGDRLIAKLHRPGHPGRRPLVLLIHGLSGSEDSYYCRVTAGHLLAAGYPVMRLNLRGAGPGRDFAKTTYHAGRSEDIASVILDLDVKLKRHGVVAIGYSLGGNVLLKYLSEIGANADLLGAVTISAPIDLRATAHCITSKRNRLYHAHLIDGMRQERGHDAKDIRTITEFDNRIVAPEAGYRDAQEYYADCSAAPRLGSIRVPTLVIHASDDPWIPVTCYGQVRWDDNPYLQLKLPVSGGHVGFHGIGLDRPWYDMAILRFLDVLRHKAH
ncbi:YheT family hydrolase [Dongia rigui]|uniref:Alpha/beta fold hydrolase n=1 Tax=Dongia rigui TaxID=940149 RepID=A0ABU5E0K7_9PROT|nr:alpha/beta fold hydrolase [Dongia rigui]MDY0873056.1 alpha/beta fold hydrolase [Dongia rigui]